MKPQAFTMPTCIMVKMVDFFCLSFRYLPHFFDPFFDALFLSLSHFKSTLGEAAWSSISWLCSRGPWWSPHICKLNNSIWSIKIFPISRSHQSFFNISHHLSVSLYFLSLSLSLSLYALVMSLLISLSLSLYHTYKHTHIHIYVHIHIQVLGYS